MSKQDECVVVHTLPRSTYGSGVSIHFLRQTSHKDQGYNPTLASKARLCKLLERSLTGKNRMQPALNGGYFFYWHRADPVVLEPESNIEAIQADEYMLGEPLEDD